mgnify:CR=1 FL=1
MAQKETRVQKIVRLTAKQFPSFGGGKLATNNPISHALKNEPPTFAAGVDIEQAVRFILVKRNAIESVGRKKIGNDARDIAFTAGLLSFSSNKVLCTIRSLSQKEIRQRIRSRIYPFSGFCKEKIETFSNLPVSWVREGAQWQLDNRKPSVARLR